MATASEIAFEIGSYFCNLYYHVLCETPEYSHSFYDLLSTMTRVDAADQTELTVFTLLDIDVLLTSLNITDVALTELYVQNSWNGSILLIVSGIIRSRNFYGRRKFTHTFFLTPRGTYFYISNDILRFQDEVPELPDILVNSQVPASNTSDEQPGIAKSSSFLISISGSSSELEETREYFNSLQVNDSPIDKYGLPDEQQHENLQSETVVEETAVEESSPVESVVNDLEDPIHWPPITLAASASVDKLAVKPAATESAGEPARLSYASILQSSMGQSSQSFVPRQPSVRQSMPAAPLELKIQANGEAVTGADDILVQEELTSVFVGSLPSHVTIADLLKELRNFGKIKPDKVFIRNNTETGACFAFVEFEDMSGVHNAIKAYP
ncbi:hypothetical protein KSS87_003873 [Heliosperma pusillum]|nr:hypothetical protein KSS87_003873 [Heliosperma pusillum]